MNKIKIAAIASILAGASHLFIQAYTHMGIYFYLIGFIAIGALQIGLGVLKLRNVISAQMFWVSTIANSVATIFWLLTRTKYAPFIGGTEHFTVLGVSVVALQLIVVALLCWERKNLRDTGLVVAASIVLGFGVFYGAVALEDIAPELRGTGAHHHGHGHADVHHDSNSSQEHEGHDAIHAENDVSQLKGDNKENVAAEGSAESHGHSAHDSDHAH